ncbi:MAG: glutamine-hydrolyzing carbamoyl-phosphate synthase small subunit, partial [Bacteroidales bacterium]|nr:glutamine-hydrolyzing carbamoyl-phosphate synthase small subunit [Bacteroidales bacterium]
EVVFNTAMTGYPESLTDPSYKGQILVLTYPLIGNYGVPPMTSNEKILNFFESDKIHISGLVISDYSYEYSHWNAVRSLADWLKENKIPAMYGVDTRAITKILREEGAMPGKLSFCGEDLPFEDPYQRNLVAEVSTKEVVTYGNGKYRVLLVDCGVKNNIMRCLLNRNTTIVRVPWDYDFSKEQYDGLFISNGPGDPKTCKATIKHLAKALEQDIPIMGICLGNQLMGLAAGGDTFKLKYGHRGHNQPVQKSGTNKTYITSQNHGFALDPDSLGEDWKPLYINLNDGTNEGVIHKNKPFCSAQFHPEATSGPVETEFLFDDFIEAMEKYRG